MKRGAAGLQKPGWLAQSGEQPFQSTCRALIAVQTSAQTSAPKSRRRSPFNLEGPWTSDANGFNAIGKDLHDRRSAEIVAADAASDTYVLEREGGQGIP